MKLDIDRGVSLNLETLCLVIDVPAVRAHSPTGFCVVDLTEALDVCFGTYTTAEPAESGPLLTEEP